MDNSPVSIKIEHSPLDSFCNCQDLKGSLSFNASFDVLKNGNPMTSERSDAFYKTFCEKRELVSFVITFNFSKENLKMKELSQPQPLLGKNLGQELFLDKKFCDVKIFCEDKIFDCHKIILCLRSEVFERMLANKMLESTTGEIKVTETSAITLEALLYFLYNDNENKIKLQDLVYLQKAIFVF